MFPQDGKVLRAPVVIEYINRGKRVSKTLPDNWATRRFYSRKLREGRHPRVVEDAMI